MGRPALSFFTRNNLWSFGVGICTIPSSSDIHEAGFRTYMVGIKIVSTVTSNLQENLEKYVTK